MEGCNPVGVDCYGIDRIDFTLELGAADTQTESDTFCTGASPTSNKIWQTRRKRSSSSNIPAIPRTAMKLLNNYPAYASSYLFLHMWRIHNLTCQCPV
jgi:hypothetical protein